MRVHALLGLEIASALSLPSSNAKAGSAETPIAGAAVQMRT